MLLSMVVSLYTSRIVLNTLGVENYGIYNVVGGIVTMFSFLNGAMATGTLRFLTFELGKNDAVQLSRVFSMSMNIHLMIAATVFVLAETLGLWFVNTELTIPTERMVAANWVYQFSVFSAIVGVSSVPYNAIIIAHERMNIYAYVSILEVALRLIIVFLLQWFGFDKLIFYSFLVFSVALTIRFIYGIYCRMNFAETKHRFFWDSSLFKSMVKFSAWYLWGSASGVAGDQGVNILLNIFFGPSVNAARSIAYSVKQSVYSFVQSFQTAINPQIIKSYASSDLKYMHHLIFQGSKFSFFLLFFLTLPALFETEIILKIWLKTVPEDSVIFTRLVIINLLIDSLSGTLMTGALASGRIEKYQFAMGSLLILNLPVSYLFLHFAYRPEITVYISITISLIALIIRLRFLRNLICLKIKEFVKQVVFKAILICLTSIVPPLILNLLIEQYKFKSIIIVISAMASVMIFVYYLGLTRNEKWFFINLARKNGLSNYFKTANGDNNITD